MDVFRGRSPMAAEAKADGSPVTQADLAANDILLRGLEVLMPGVPVVSEESLPEGSPWLAWDQYWLVDPLDGTREFVAGREGFTVNVALMERVGGDVRPTLGVVQAPASGATFVGASDLGMSGLGMSGRSASDHGAWSVKGSDWTPIKATAPAGSAVAMVSRSHGTQETAAFVEAFERRYGPTSQTAVGSSLKLCEIAAGRAHVYPRFGPTNEWDTAAGDAVLTAAGGRILQAGTRMPLAYGKPSLLNPSFVAVWDAQAELPEP